MRELASWTATAGADDVDGALAEAAALGSGPRPAAPFEAVTPAPPVAAIAGLGRAVPPTVIPSSAIAARLGVEERWITSRTGVEERRVVRTGERLDALAAAAGADALAAAGVAAADLDLVLVATFTADELLPGAAPAVARLLGATRAGALDLNAACAGFLAGLALAAGQIESGRARSVLLIGADQTSRLVDPDDRATAALFGDGAGAACLVAAGAADRRGHVGPVVLGADADHGAGTLTATRDRPILVMDGHETFKWAVARLVEVTRDAVARAGLVLDDVDRFVYHQANGRILAAVADRLDLPRDRVVDVVARYANTSAASVPIALADAAEAGLLAPGDKVLCAAFGAGFAWGGTVVTWGTVTHAGR